LLLNPVAQDLENATAVARFGVLLNRCAEEATAFGQAIGFTQVVSADVFELLVDQ
jgi:hypothetical protein